MSHPMICRMPMLSQLQPHCHTAKKNGNRNRNRIKAKGRALRALCLLSVAILLLWNQGRVLIANAEKTFVGLWALSAFHSSETAVSPCAVVRYFPDDADYIPLIRRTVDLYFPLLMEDYGLKDCPPVTILVYHTPAQLLKATGLKGQSPMGAYYGGMLHVLSPQAWLTGNEADVKAAFLQNGPLIHELSHYFTDIKTNGHYDVWYSEGLALYYENKYTGFEWRKDLAGVGKNITAQDLRLKFHETDQAVAYRQAYELVAGLAAQKGEKGMQLALMPGENRGGNAPLGVLSF